MEYKPILFNPEMIKAILEDRKTKTRRIAGPNYCNTHMELVEDEHGPKLIEKQNVANGIYTLPAIERQPKYHAGDILWVRERWRVGAWDSERQAIAVDYAVDEFARKEWIRVPQKSRFEKYMQQTLEDVKDAGMKMAVWEPGKGPARWRPSLFMPKELARIFLRVTGTRAERLQDITVQEIQEEGVLQMGYLSQYAVMTSDCFERWAALWNSTVKPYAWKWAANPWVWVIEFERIEGPPAGFFAGRDTTQYADSGILMPAT